MYNHHSRFFFTNFAPPLFFFFKEEKENPGTYAYARRERCATNLRAPLSGRWAPPLVHVTRKRRRGLPHTRWRVKTCTRFVGRYWLWLFCFSPPFPWLSLFFFFSIQPFFFFSILNGSPVEMIYDVYVCVCRVVLTCTRVYPLNIPPHRVHL